MQCTREYLDDIVLEWFGLSADPFDDPANPEDLYLSPANISAEKAMREAVRRRHLLAICGEPGSGKSALLRRFISKAQNEQLVRVIEPASLDRRHITARTLAVAILRVLIQRDTSPMGSEAQSELLQAALREQVASGMFPVLIMDEAHLLQTSALLAVKQLWDSSSAYKHLSVCLVGHLALANALRANPAIRELGGRTKVVEMQAMFNPKAARGHGADVATAYLDWRLSKVGADVRTIFDDLAIQEIARRGEYPLWINNLSVRAMQYAHAAGDKLVLAEHVGRV